MSNFHDRVTKCDRSYFATEQKHYKVILAVRRPPQAIARRLLAILKYVTADEMNNQVRYI